MTVSITFVMFAYRFQNLAENQKKLENWREVRIWFWFRETRFFPSLHKGAIYEDESDGTIENKYVIMTLAMISVLWECSPFCSDCPTIKLTDC